MTDTISETETIWWECPECKGTWMIDADIEAPPQTKENCCNCSKPPNAFPPGSIVKVTPNGCPEWKVKWRPFLAIMGYPAQIEVIDPSIGIKCRGRG